MCSLRNKEVEVVKLCHVSEVLGVCSSEAAIVTMLTFCLDLGIVVVACSLSLLFLISCLSTTTWSLQHGWKQGGEKEEHTPAGGRSD